MRIAELARRTGVSPRRLRHYEAKGLLTPARDERGWRHYDDHDRLRVEAIDRLIRSGLPTELAAPILAAGPGDAGQPDGLLAEVVALYRQLDDRTRCLSRNRDALAAWLSTQGVRVSTPPAGATSDGDAKITP